MLAGSIVFSMEIIHYHFDTIPSTNEWAKANLCRFEKGKLTLVTADGQTAGKGRLGRTWVSPAHLNLYVSFCFFIEEHQDPLVLTRTLALATAKALEERGIACQLKWPNDLLVNQKKIAGILCELADSFAIIGLGLNVNMPEKMLQEVGQPATSLLNETGHTWDIVELLESIQDHFIKILNRPYRGSPSDRDAP